MRRKTRTKVKKGLIIAGIVMAIIAIIVGIIILIEKNKETEISYDDVLVGKNYFKEITINMSTKEVKRDNKNTSLEEEFGISEEQENRYFSSKEEMNNFLSTSVFEIENSGQMYTIKNPFQTKSIIVEADEIKEKEEGSEVTEIADGLYILKFYSEKLTKEMYNFYQEKNYIKKVFLDEIYIDEPINDVSQMMYGESPVDLQGHYSLGVMNMKLDNYFNIINENGNPSDIVISTIGYGINYNHQFFENRIDNNCYNYMLDNQDISETIEQGSRIAEVLVDSTTENVRIMPLVTVTDEGYVSLTSILRAIKQGIEKSDVICYELISTKHETIDIALEKAFKENIPVCSVSTSDRENYPANQGMTIATSSMDRNMLIAEYSSQEEYIDFSAPSTDVEEIFRASNVTSRWSGPQYSNAQIVAAIALIKTYNKDATILDVYNFLRNFCRDLGEEGKDVEYGYGCPSFENLTIADIDKKAPELKEIKYENENWEVLKHIQIIAKDNIRMRAWAVTNMETEPSEEEWQVLEAVTPDLDVTTDITENGTYYIWIQDIAGNTVNKSIQVDKIDNTPPTISYTIDEETLSQGYVTINVTAEDSQSGLYDSPFSWDNSTWSQENSTRQVKENGRYKVYAVDKLGNTSEQEIVVNSFPQEGIYQVGEGNIITSANVSAEWNGNLNNNVQITLNKDADIAGWQLTTTNYYIPENFVNVEPVRIETVRNNTENNNQNEDVQNNTTNTNAVNTSVPSNVVLDNSINTNFSTTNNTNNATNNNEVNNQNTQTQVEEVQIPIYSPRPEPIIIKTSMNADTIYYLWVKDGNGNVDCQVITISKAVY